MSGRTLMILGFPLFFLLMLGYLISEAVREVKS